MTTGGLVQRTGPPRPGVPGRLRHAKATDAAQKKAAQPERTWLECMKASYGKAPDPVHLTADGVTWRATWEPQAEAPAGNVNDTGKVDPTERAALDAL